MNSNFGFTKEEQKMYDNIVSLLDEAMKPEIEKEEQRRKEHEKRERFKQEIQRKKYLESLKPISLDEFTRRIKLVFERYQNFLKYRQKENILFCSIDLNFNKIINKAKIANNGFELAEILDKAEKTMSDMEGIKNIVEMDNEVIHKKIEEIKKQKSIQER